MFFKPTLNAVTVAAPSEDFQKYWSDFHKDAFGCRPRIEVSDWGVEEATCDAWFAESQRIDELAAEVGRFRFSQRMEYLRRRGDATDEKDAFIKTIQAFKTRPYPNDQTPTWADVMGEVAWYGWDYIAMDCGLPGSDGKRLQAEWERLNA